MISEYLRREATGGRLLLAATGIALVWANLPGDSYSAVWGTGLGPLTLAEWVTDGLLAVFFVVAGLELRRELTVGELAGWQRAALPLAATAGGMVMPAIVSIIVSRGATAHGGVWAVPVATDIAFALGVLTLAGVPLPAGVRALLLSIAVIDDLAAVSLVATVFADHLHAGWLVAGLAVCALYGLAPRKSWVIVPALVVAWWCAHKGGVHPTVAGAILGLLTPAGPGDRIQHHVHPWSAGAIVPLFALAAAGIPLGAASQAWSDPVAHGIVAGLLVGKTVGILGGAWLAAKLRFGVLPQGVTWADALPVALLGGVGYTVSLLISGLSLPPGGADRAAAAVLAASVTASVVGLAALRLRTRKRQPAGPRA